MAKEKIPSINKDKEGNDTAKSKKELNSMNMQHDEIVKTFLENLNKNAKKAQVGK